MAQGRATFRGHPLHLMLVSFPVASWTGAVATDIATLAGSDPFWPRMSETLIVAGVVTGALSALPGYIDYRTAPMSEAGRRTGGRHLLTALVTLAIYAIAAVLRAGDAASRLGIGFSMAGAAVLFAAGWYGSELANRHRIGIAERP